MLKMKPITFKMANEYVRQYHRHHKQSVGCKFCLSVTNDNVLCGVAIVGRPVSRVLDDGYTIEVNRLCTDGTKNACSLLYSSAAKIAKSMGYKKIITYILETELGTSLKASGWIISGKTIGREWDTKSRRREHKKGVQLINKIRWEKSW